MEYATPFPLRATLRRGLTHSQDGVSYGHG
jgi:hypothetical protein